jgi:hypothetical protein
MKLITKWCPRARDFKNTTMTEYAFILSAVAMMVFTGYTIDGLL